MANGVDLTIEAGVVRVTYHGDVRFEFSADALAEAFRLALANDSHWVLVDIRDAHDPYYTTSAAHLAERAPSLGMRGERLRVAILGRKNDERLAFMENVSVNRGLPVRVFEDEGMALGWLMGAM